MSNPTFALPEKCPDCGGALVSTTIVARGLDNLAGMATEAPVKYFVDTEGQRVSTADGGGLRGTVKAMLCTDCRRLFFYGLPISLEPAKRLGPSRSQDEPLELARECIDRQPLVRVEHEGPITVVQLIAERLKGIDDRIYQQLALELGNAAESCHARVVLDLGHFVPTYHSSAFVSSVIRFKRRWLERHVAPLDPKVAADANARRSSASGNAKPNPQPSIRQLSFPVVPNRDAALSTLVSAPEGASEVVLCNVHRTFYDVLKVTRLVRS